MKIIFAIIILIAAAPISVFMVKSCVERSKSNKTSLFGSFNSEYRDDPLGKVTPAFLEGLEEAQQRKPKAKKKLSRKTVILILAGLFCVVAVALIAGAFLQQWKPDGTSRQALYDKDQMEKHFTHVGDICGEDVYTYGIETVSYKTITGKKVSLKKCLKDGSMTRKEWLKKKEKCIGGYYSVYRGDGESVKYICYGDIVIVTDCDEDPEDVIEALKTSRTENSNVNIKFIPSVIYGHDMDFNLYYSYSGNTRKRVKNIEITDIDPSAEYNGCSVYDDMFDMKVAGKKTRVVEWGIGFDTEDGLPKEDITFSKAKITYNDNTEENIDLGQVTILAGAEDCYLSFCETVEPGKISYNFEAPRKGRLFLDEKTEEKLNETFEEWNIPRLGEVVKKGDNIWFTAKTDNKKYAIELRISIGDKSYIL